MPSYSPDPPETPIRMKGGGAFGREPGEWADATQMAICVAESASTGPLDPVEVARPLPELVRRPTSVQGLGRSLMGLAHPSQ